MRMVHSEYIKESTKKMMGIQRSTSFLVLFFTSFILQSYTTLAEKKPYIVYFGAHSHSKNDISALSDAKITSGHVEFLGSFVESKEKAHDAIFYSYTKYINGFAANLDKDEALEISKHPEVVSVFPSRGYKLHTTRTWDFLGLERNGRVPSQSLWTKARFGEDVIMAHLDTGVWPESASFRDEGMGPIPSKWKGVCQKDSDKIFPCNRKLIGARYYNKGYIAAGGNVSHAHQSPRDFKGHGTHTLSTLGGVPAPHASFNGYGNGTASGGSPKARVATYKVCWSPAIDDGACFDSDILAAIDDAIHDGVDILSVSLGASPVDYIADAFAIGSFQAVKNGLTVVCSAGNNGTYASTVTNIAPWILTVAASTLDRQSVSYLSYNNKHVKGLSYNSSISLPGNKFYPMVSSVDAKASNASLTDAQSCIRGSLDPEKAKGKIVVCLYAILRENAIDMVEMGKVVKGAGGVGMVVANDERLGDYLTADWHVLPATYITYADGVRLFSYLNSTKSAYGYLTRPKTELGAVHAPVMADFSSLGPNQINPEILKPDITAPGVDVIAAWTEADTPGTHFKMISGTSMSCPHIAGVVGLLKTLHPDWSHAAIRSAIMTSARTTDNKHKTIADPYNKKATPFNYGSGHVRPNRAMNPGLIYDLTITDYLDFLCANGYNSSQIVKFSNKPYSCPSNSIRLEDLNYPSITVPRLSGEASVTRTVRNVGSPGTYLARVISPEGVSVVVKPSKLEFSKTGEEKKFEVVLKAKGRGPKAYVFGTLIWSDGEHYVRSPIVVKS